MLSSSSQAVYDTVPYTLAAGETVSLVAKKYHLTVDELKKINQFRSFSKPFSQLGGGDEIDIPRTTSLPLQANRAENEQPPPSSSYKERLAHNLLKGATVLADDNTSQAAANMARSLVVTEANDSVQHWLSQFGTARVQLNVNDKFNLEGSSVDLLVPLYDDQESLLFSQFGLRNRDSRNTVNLGVGARKIQGNWLYGANAFFDRDLTGKNNRVGFGLEAWTDYLKLSANSYLGLTGWHQSRDFADYNERPANGYDLRMEAYLPAYPQLGGKLMYEQYWGDEVALFGKDDRQKNPYAVTAGVSYTPIPLVTIGLDYRAGKGGQNDTNLNVQMNYRFGEPWESQIDPAAVAASRTLAGSRYDLVERNNNIVLDYQKQALIQLALPDQLTGSAFEIIKIDAQVTAKYGLERIDWDTASLVAAGGMVVQTSAQSISIKLPPYHEGSNVYTLGAVAYDSQGNASNRSTTRIIVTQQSIGHLNSTLEASPAEIPADGVAASLLTLSLRDVNNQPVRGQGDQLTLDVHFTPDATATQPSSHPLLSAVTESAPGVYTYTLTAGFAQGEAIITPVINDISLASAKVILTESTQVLSPENSLFSVEPAEIVADGVQTSTLSFTAQDIHHRPIKGLTVTFGVTDHPEVALSEVTENNGVYSAKLSGVAAGTVAVVPMVNGVAVEGKSQNVVLVADHDTAEVALTVLVDDALANGVDINKVKARVTDRHGNPLEDVAVEFEVGNSAALVTSSEVTDHEGLATVTLGNIHTGVTTVTATVGEHQEHIDTYFVAETPVALLIYRNGAELTEHPIVGDTLAAVAMCSIALCNGVPVNYQWEAESSVGSGVFIAIPGATSETLTVTGDLQRRAIRVVSH
ncbi:inverse autotransporter beta-barrel domain-containing protein [Chania multitudinisentens]|uniref:inverse autotransporter beta-barrel domain-containing protein n=1 Tax=Chania multitudinisentens TaxID=1639108 RepID=UPI00046790AF|nr:inverse autotransporter beta-barrel domain-containing protein [Chania multitudinisentens]